jgi:hypothetical protein
MYWEELYNRMQDPDPQVQELAFQEFFERVVPILANRFRDWQFFQQEEAVTLLAFRFARELAIRAIAHVADQERIHRVGFQTWLKITTRDSFFEYWNRQTGFGLAGGQWGALPHQLAEAIGRLDRLQVQILLEIHGHRRTLQETAVLLRLPLQDLEARYQAILNLLEEYIDADLRELLGPPGE